MQELANRLMRQGSHAGSFLPAAIFGSSSSLTNTLNLNRPRLRIGLWPTQSESHPEIAMGLATVLALLLERYRDVRVYRLFVQAEGDPDEYEWDIEQSQFDVDDWQLDDLDENVALWGRLEKTDSGWSLTMNIENDLLEEGEDLKTLDYKAANLHDLVEQLPRIATGIAEFLEADDTRLIVPIYTAEQWGEAEVEVLLEAVFEWELDFFLQLWGQEWSEDEIRDDKDALLNAGQPLGDFGTWVVSSTIGRTLQSADSDTSEVLVPIAIEIIRLFDKSPIPAILLAQSLHESGHVDEAHDLIKENIANYPDSPIARLTQAELYRRSGKIVESINAFQEAIEDDVVNAPLFMRYADIIQVMDYNSLSVENYIMIDPLDYDSDRMTWEAAESYQAVLELEPDNRDALYRQLLLLLDVGAGGERFWNGFKRLGQLDKTGDQIRGLVDALYTVENMTPAFEILKITHSLEPERYDILINLAAAYLVDEQGDNAKIELQKARRLTDDPVVLADIDRLMLAAEDPDFEARIGEITDIVSAGNPLETDDVEFLEAVTEKVPSFAEAYIFLAKTYAAWDERSTAIEVLLDGHKANLGDPNIAALLGQLLWEAGEHELAFSYLMKGIEKSPNYVPLLAIAGRYLFEDGQEDMAKAYLTHATMISPNDPTLLETRAIIARMIANE
jgi:tetratricopeptide (TPR) repeat protein